MKILSVSESYLPGTKGGGPIRALANMTEQLGETHCFYIFTCNHDYNDPSIYPAIESNRWQVRGGASVYYSDRADAIRALIEQIKQLRPDWIYLNGALPPLTRGFLQARKKSAILHKIPVLLAPHGNLSISALSNKRLQKSAWLLYAKVRGLYEQVIWHAASEREAEQIQHCFGPGATIRVVPMAPKKVTTSKGEEAQIAFAANESGIADALTATGNENLRLVYFGRLSPEKNLAFAFQLLAEYAAQHPQQQILYDLIGSGSGRYQAKLNKIAARLPASVQINFIGQLSPEDLTLRIKNAPVVSNLPRYHAMFMPSITENFSYTVLESWQAGIPVLISDQTPWRGLEASGIGWDLSLKNKSAWLSALSQLAERDAVAQVQHGRQAAHFGDQHAAHYPKAAKQLFIE